MSNIHVTEVETTLAGFISNAEDGQNAHLSDSGNAMIYRDGTTRRMWAPNAETTDGEAITYKNATYKNLSAEQFITPAVKLTTTGGVAVLLQNKTGGASVKGYVVTPYATTAIDEAVKSIVVNVPDPIGVFLDADVADGDMAWVVVAGIAQVYFNAAGSTRGHFVRGFITGDANYTAGMALSEAVPTSPFATDKHFYEIGHCIESRTGAGLAKCVLHFN